MIVIAGPCAVENENYLKIANEVKKAGATHLRGGIFKPRSAPFRWQGIGHENLSFGLELLKEAKRLTGLPIVSEAMNVKQIDILYKYIDIFQVGSRNMTNSELLKEFGKQDKPILLKRGFGSTIEELVMCADFIIDKGNEKVILCERGIRTFETYTRNTFDINCIPAIRSLCDLPIIADTSHGTGRRELVVPVALAAIAAGADGLMIEVHNNPEEAKTDGKQSLNIIQFNKSMGNIEKLNEFMINLKNGGE